MHLIKISKRHPIRFKKLNNKCICNHVKYHFPFKYFIISEGKLYKAYNLNIQ